MITALGNDNYLVAAGGSLGSIRLMSGSSGLQIGPTLVRGTLNDGLGNAAGITELASNNYAVLSRYDDVGGIVNAGSVRLVNGGTGEEIKVIYGAAEDDMQASKIIKPINGDYFILSQPSADASGAADSGMVRVCGLTGSGC